MADSKIWLLPVNAEVLAVDMKTDMLTFANPDGVGQISRSPNLRIEWTGIGDE